MREIKFRGKSKRTGQWIYGDLLTSPNGLLKYIVQKSRINEAFLENLIPEEIEYGSDGEYTGLKDKNGVKIYEGDILKPKNGKLRKVIYHGGSFKHSSHSKRGGKEPLFPQLIHIRQFEVIGNIFENPELLEK